MVTFVPTQGVHVLEKKCRKDTKKAEAKKLVGLFTHTHDTISSHKKKTPFLTINLPSNLSSFLFVSSHDVSKLFKEDDLEIEATNFGHGT